MVAQVDEEQLPMIALAMNPAGEPDGGAGIAEAELAASMGSVSVHHCAFGKSRFPPPGEGRNTTRATEDVKAGGGAGEGRMAAAGGGARGAVAPQDRVCNRAAGANEAVQRGGSGLSGAAASGRENYL